MIQVLLAPTADLARHIYADITVEAEYGSFVAEGGIYTAAHHQPVGSPFAGRHVVEGGRPSPCNDNNIPRLATGVILVSHVDLDTFGGCLRAMGYSGLFVQKFQPFWDLAEFVDTNGAHKLARAGASTEDVRRLYAYWAWAKESTPRFPRDTVSDITHVVLCVGVALSSIFEVGMPVNHKLLAKGDAFRVEEAGLNRRTFFYRSGQILVRRAKVQAEFVNHLYAEPDGAPAKGVVTLNDETGAITLSIADPTPGVSCREIAQKLWGEEAGGHDGIAGSPRGVRYGLTELAEATNALEIALL